ncbi:UDP-Glycosyltransferase superfamily protein [Striga hermonthica]|uniref:UDP-Glycosyltransferase superfamily protein n=1 Tax=Striga hermonthica TaxID=68872 RepID=A0A9N7NV87_STRHE|nr:UDP-Glycosyltransferase superfamily protein [Striga hermonthica]
MLTKANFLWVVRFPPGEDKTVGIEEKLPVGFLQETKGRGMIVHRWAPQVKILSHPSVGAFVSHCGASGAMESMYFGVPVIAMPMKFEQPLNTRLLVEVGVAVEVEKAENRSYYYSGEELAMAINKVILVEKEFGGAMRDRAKELSVKIKGRAPSEMNEVEQELVKICLMNKKNKCDVIL